MVRQNLETRLVESLLVVCLSVFAISNRCSKDSCCAHKGLVTNWPHHTGRLMCFRIRPSYLLQVHVVMQGVLLTRQPAAPKIYTLYSSLRTLEFSQATISAIVAFP